MSFNASVPLNSDSPSIFPAQNQTNMTRLQTIVGADHQFNLTAAADDGYHNLIHLTQQAPSGALAALGRLYGKSSSGRVHQFYMDSAGTEYQITPTMPIRAAVNFDGTGGVGAQSIRSQYNVSSVSKTADGTYTINFTTAMPDANYMVFALGMRNTSSFPATAIPQVLGDPTYGSSVTTASVKIQFVSDSGNLRNVLMGNVVIMSVA